jgi:hypothetical protein
MRLLSDLQWRNFGAEFLENWSVGSWRTQAELDNYIILVLHTLYRLAHEDGTDRVFRNVGI